MTQLYFKLEYTIRELRLAHDRKLTIVLGGSHDTRVEIRSPSDDEQALGHLLEHAFCTASSVREPNNRVCNIFAEIEGNHTLSNYCTDVAMSYDGKDGSRIETPHLCVFPKPFRSFVQDVSAELRELSVRAVSVLRWRANRTGPHDPISSRGLFWSCDNMFWHPMPSDLSVRMEVLDTFCPSEEVNKDVESMVIHGDRAPVHHDLFREAWSQRFENSRSALVIGMSAAEIAVKHCISELIPDVKWLATNLPTPPLHQILTDYFPKLPTKLNFCGVVKSPPDMVLEDIKKGIQMRNHLVHTDKDSPPGDKVQSILFSIRDLLWLIDYYTGHEWALEYLLPETRRALETD